MRNAFPIALLIKNVLTTALACFDMCADVNKISYVVYSY